MFKKKKVAKKEKFQIVFCDENNLTTEFHVYGTYETYETADHIIRMSWNKKRKDKVNNGYKVDGVWILIKKTLDK